MSFFEGDGVRENIYHLLWKKDKNFNGNSLKINIPDTIIYKNKQPT